MNRTLTHRQQQILAYCQEFYLENDQIPTLECIAKRFGFASNTAAACHLGYLHSKGVLEKNAVGKWKFAAEYRPPLASKPVERVPLLRLPLLQYAHQVRARNYL